MSISDGDGVTVSLSSSKMLRCYGTIKYYYAVLFHKSYTCTYALIYWQANNKISVLSIEKYYIRKHNLIFISSPQKLTADILRIRLFLQNLSGPLAFTKFTKVVNTILIAVFYTQILS